MSFKVCSVICLLFGSVFSKEVIECNNKSEDKFDTYLMEMTTFGDPDGKYPSNMQELANQCKVDRAKMQWSVAYTDKCLRGVTQELMSVSMRELDRTLTKYCDSARLSKILISWSECGNKALNETVRCWQNYILQMERVSVEKGRIPNSDKAPLICCNFHQFDHCLEEAFISQGEGICPQKVVSGLHSMVNEVAGTSVEIFCGEYSADNDKCDAIHKKYKHLEEIKFEKPINKSPINPFVEIIGDAGFVLKMKSSCDRS